MSRLGGQVAIVTGAGSGIGLGIAGVLRSEGAAVLAADLDPDRARAAATHLGPGEQVADLAADVTEPDDAALAGLMRSAALEVARSGVTINAVLPGSIRTPGFGDLGPEHERRMLGPIPLGRVGEPEDVGWAVRFLASPEAGYITGQTLIIDGGQVLPEGAD